MKENKSMNKLVPRFIKKYKEEIVPYMKKEFGYKNNMEIPKIKAITVSAGFNEEKDDPKKIENIINDVMAITGQRPVLTKSKKAISNFKIRKGDSVGLMVTLRKNRMYEFFDRLISVAIPRIKDFNGLSNKSFDGNGNYSFGLTEQIIFPEVDYDKVDQVRGMNITITTNADSDEEAYKLLLAFGFPIIQKKNKG